MIFIFARTSQRVQRNIVIYQLMLAKRIHLNNLYTKYAKTLDGPLDLQDNIYRYSHVNIQ